MKTTKGEIEITRSFSYKLGRPNYSSADFFCSVTDVCAREDVAKVGKALHEFCKAEVQRSIGGFLEAIDEKKRAELAAEKQKATARSTGKSVAAERKDVGVQNAEMDAGNEMPEL